MDLTQGDRILAFLSPAKYLMLTNVPGTEWLDT